MISWLNGSDILYIEFDWYDGDVIFMMRMRMRMEDEKSLIIYVCYR